VLGGVTLLGLMSSPVASAHTGDLATGLLSGLLHPFSGADHLLMIIAVGIYSARNNNPLRFALPCVFLIALATGAQFGSNAFSADVMDAIIVTSLLAAGLLLMLAEATAPIWIIAIVTFAGVIGGLAHGLEIPPDIAGLTFITGFVTSSAALLISCLWIGHTLAPIKIESPHHRWQKNSDKWFEKTY
jgi:urease accessory protein